jgi:hypothetical protein
MAVLINKKGLSAVIHLTANATVNVTGAVGVSDIAVGDEVVTGATITQIWYGCANGGHWEIKRGANTAAVVDSTGYMDFAGNGVTLNKDATAATLVANLNTTTTGFVVIELTKNPTTSVYA